MSNKLILILSLIFLFTSCKETKDTPKVCEIPYGGTIGDTRPEYGISNYDPRTFNTADIVNTFNASYEGLTRLDHHTLETLPCIAKRWESNKNCTSFTFTIRKGVFFHPPYDTVMVTAQHVKDCFDRLTDTLTNNIAYSEIKNVLVGAVESRSAKMNGNNEQKIKGVALVNDSTLSISLLSPYCDFPSMLTSIHYAIYPTMLINDNDAFNDSILVGTGAFTFNTLDDSSYLFVKNEQYWRTDSNGFSLPYVDSLYFIYDNNVKGSFDKRINSLTSNRIHLMRDVGIRYIDKLVNIKGFDEKLYKSVEILGNSTLSFNTSKPPFNNILLRKAIAHSFNNELFIDSLFLGENWAASEGLYPQSSLYSDTLKSLTYDPKLANQYLAEYKKQTGIQKVVIEVLSVKNRGWFPKNTANFIKKVLDIEIKIIDKPSIPDYFNAIFKGDYQLCNFSNSIGFPEVGGHLSNFSSDALSDDTNEIINTNVFRYNNEKFDKLYHAAKKERNIEKRKKMFAKAEQLLINEAVSFPIFYSEESFYQSPLLGGYPYNNIDMVDHALLYLKQ